MTKPSPKLAAKPYPEVNPSPDFSKIEEGILGFWRGDGTFQKSIECRVQSAENGTQHSPLSTQHSKNFVFYDGPPFANGLPHYGHLLTGFVKDIFARYQTMKGKKVERRFGWDCHGLPAEMGAEKELGIAGRQEIEKFGIAKFNAHCRKSVMKYTHEWEYYVTRQARWVDFKNDYKTMDLNYMESVMWAFKTLYDKGLIYESHRVMPYSWAMETPLSNFETRMDNSYRERTDKAVTVAFILNNIPNFISSPSLMAVGADPAVLLPVLSNVRKCRVLAWTTTPWTLPSNLALAVAKSLHYVCRIEGDTCIIQSVTSSHLFDNVARNFDHASQDQPIYLQQDGAILVIIKGSDLIGLSYHPLFPYFPNHKHAFRILDGSDFISDAEGTGIVHLAPGFGEDDQRVCEANGIELVCPVDERGRYTDEIFDLPDLKLKGLNVAADKNKNPDEPYKPEQLEKYGLANLRIIEWLKKTGALIHQEDFKHNYPHCWRTDTPLIYRALPSWYVEVTKFRDRMVELNQQINWIPGHIKDGRFGKWLEGARDWSISRNRYWGCPIPIWRSKSGKIKVFGSIAELEKISGKKITDLHRPFVDEIVITEGGEEYARVPDVLDCWFESGAMPFAQVHYPFENKDWFERHFPADFIVEYEAQTRGWFYTLMVLGTALFDKPPFKNCICHGVVLDDKGQKLSKRLNNYVDPKEIFGQYGADALRWLMCASPVMHGHELHIDKDGKFIRDAVRLYIKPIWNAYNFFTLYANADGVKAEFSSGSDNLMDGYILAKCRDAVAQAKTALDSFDTPKAYKSIQDFFEVLNNWYIRRSKERFWKSGHDNDKQTAYNTLYTLLHVMCRTMAPLLPLVSEEIYRGLTGEESVHLTEFPKMGTIENVEFDGQAFDKGDFEIINIIQNMDKVREICNAAHAVRNVENIRIRQPLAKLSVYSESNSTKFSEVFGWDRYYEEIIRDEANVKEVAFSENLAGVAVKRLEVNARQAAKRKEIAEKMKQIIPASKKGEWKLTKIDDLGIPIEVEVAGEILVNTYYTDEDGEVDYQFSIKLEPKDKKGASPLSTNDALVILDLTITPELEMEGIARDVVRFIQQSRKDANLNIADRIVVSIRAEGKIEEAIKANKAYIMEQVLAASLELGKAEGKHKFETELDEGKINLEFSVV